MRKVDCIIHSSSVDTVISSLGSLAYILCKLPLKDSRGQLFKINKIIKIVFAIINILNTLQFFVEKNEKLLQDFFIKNKGVFGYIQQTLNNFTS